MPKFIKKPVAIDAVQFKGSMTPDLESLLHSGSGVAYEYDALNQHLHIRTLEGIMTAMPDDWIIKGVRGEFYPCKPDIFQETYRPMVESTCGP